VVARDVHGIYAPWDSAHGWGVGMWLGGWYVACGDGGYKSPVSSWALLALSPQHARGREWHRPSGRVKAMNGGSALRNAETCALSWALVPS
jgi:hypothetical protein